MAKQDMSCTLALTTPEPIRHGAMLEYTVVGLDDPYGCFVELLGYADSGGLAYSGSHAAFPGGGNFGEPFLLDSWGDGDDPTMDYVMRVYRKSERGKGSLRPTISNVIEFSTVEA